MSTQEMQRRTKRLGSLAIEVVRTWSQHDGDGVPEHQLARSGTPANKITSITAAAVETARPATPHRPSTAASIRAISGCGKSSPVNRPS
jgi:hypothetical protein